MKLCITLDKIILMIGSELAINVNITNEAIMYNILVLCITS